LPANMRDVGDAVPYDVDDIYTAALSDKKRSGGTITEVIPTALGNCKLMAMPVEELRDWIELGMEG